MPETARLIGLLHDAGKFQQAFVDYLLNETARRGSVIHAIQGAKYAYDVTQTAEIHPLIGEIVAMCVANHHGALVDGITPEGNTPLLTRISSVEESLNYDEVVQAFAVEVRVDIEKLLQAANLELDDFCKRCEQKKLDAPFALHLLIKSLFSALVDADQFGAYCFDCRLDPLEKPPPPPWSQLRQQLEVHLQRFAADSPIDALRARISTECLAASGRSPGVFRLDIPTGGGKTFSSLRFALSHAEEYGFDHVILVIPYLSVLEQTASRMREALGCDEGSETILEHHSDVLLSDEEEAAKTYRLLTSRWSSPIIITTMVQFLESLYSAKKSKLRKLHNMLNSVIIVDEAQAVPVKCSSLFNEAINYLATVGGSTVVVCTATQPEVGATGRALRLSAQPDLASASGEQFAAFSRTVLVDLTDAGRYSMGANELRDLTLGQWRAKGSCLVVLNTKNEARELFQALKEAVEQLPVDSQPDLTHLSTNMCSEHRKAVIAPLKDSVDGVICVSTQLIEAGVDLSFGCVIRALAGLDSIAQAAGRCNRNGEYPDLREVFVVKLEHENLRHLPDIEFGAKQAARVLREAAKEEANPLAPEMIARYYKYFFHRDGNLGLLDFPISDQGRNMTAVDLLGCNCKGVGAYGNRSATVKPLVRQAFRTAGDAFHVIEPGGTSVIVPFGEAKELVKSFSCTRDLKEQGAILRKLSHFTVNVYEYQRGMLEQQGGLSSEGDLTVLSLSFYDPELGLALDGKPEFYYA